MNAKFFFVPALSLSALLAVVLAPPTVRGEGAADEPAVTALLAEVAAQQVVIAENQTKIDAKLAVVAENVRVARIFVSRGGGGKNP